MPKTQANARFLHEYLHDVIVDTHRVTDKNEKKKKKKKRLIFVRDMII